MNVEIDLIDTQNPDHVLSLQKAVASSVVLDWKGGDKKDGLGIVGSSLSFTLVGPSIEDGQYIDLFTGDETRYRVEAHDGEGTYYWRGHLLPDAMNEPYSNDPILVDFLATDGLGRLKGKYLSDDFYKEEKSVIAIIGECLRLTGLTLDFRFTPAIENYQQKDYNLIFIDTSLFKEKEKKQDAYKILDDLLSSMLCVCYQADDYFNIEGLNIREQRVYTANIYANDATFLGTSEITRNLKQITATGIPPISIQPPYGIINVSHQREPLEFAETVAEEKNDGWVLMENVSEPIYATDWIGHNGMEAVTGDAMTVGFFPSDAGYISLKERIYVKKGQKLKLKLGFKLHVAWGINLTEEQTRELVEGDWKNPFPIDVRIHYKGSNIDDVPSIALRNYFPDADSNFGRYFSLEFDENGEAEKELQFIPNYSGLLDIRMFHIPTSVDNSIGRIDFTEISLEEITFEEEFISEVNLEGYTLKKELKLTYADDATGLSKSFRLQKIKDPGNQNIISVPVTHQLFRDGFWYVFADLKGVNLISDNKDHVRGMLGEPIEVLEVIFNFKNSQEHAVKVNAPVPGEAPQLTVMVYDLNRVIEDRNYWEEWSDSMYNIQRKRYGDVASDVLRLLFNSTLPKLEVNAKNNIKFNDFIGFNYMRDRQWMLTNVKWDIDKGFSRITAAQAYYGVEAGVNLPPVVEAGPDLYLGATTTGHGLFCESYDPDGFIVSHFWEILEGSGVISNPNAKRTNVFYLTDDYYKFRVTVTDNNGATATDTVKWYRYQETELTLEKTGGGFYGSDNMGEFWEYTVRISPEISSDATINIQGALQLEIEGYAFGSVTVTQNGRQIQEIRGVRQTGQSLIKFDPIGFSVVYSPGDDIKITIVLDPDGEPVYIRGGFTIEIAEFIDGYGEVIVSSDNDGKSNSIRR